MPRLAANLTMLFNEAGFLDRFRAAADSGFTAVEYLFPYDFEIAVLKRKLVEHGLTQVLHNLPAGDWASGERGIACLPDRVAEFEAGVAKAIQYATALGCPRVNCLAGVTAGVDDDSARETFVNNLRYAAPRLKAAGIRLLIEPINTRDIPGFFLSRTAQALDIIDDVASDNLFLQYDVYHMHVMQEDVEGEIGAHLSRIDHIQIADAPGRHEPGTGEIDFPRVFSLIDRRGYPGWTGCEYNPAATTAAGLEWAKPYLAARA